MPHFLRSPALALAASWFVALTAHAAADDTQSLATTPEGLFPFVLPWDDASPGVTDLALWQVEPAGARGFVFAAEGHLYTPGKDGEQRERIRFLGVNMSFAGNFPTAQEADKIAARLAKFGINCVRFHHMDRDPAPKGLWSADLRTLDRDQLERLDYFVATLKARGIYSNLNLHVSRSYPGFPTGAGIPYAHKGLDLFTPKMIDAQRDYARQLLHHVNRHTGRRYAEEPAVAFVEINNENGIVCRWWDRSFDAAPAELTAELGRQWHEWTIARHGSAAAALDAWRGPEIPLGEELLRNGRFSGGIDAWKLEQPATEEPWLSLTPAEKGTGATLTPIRAEDEKRAELFQRGLQLAPGRLYTVRVKAESAKPGKITVSVKDARPPWAIHFSSPLELTAKGGMLEASFVYEGAADAPLRINFSHFADLEAPLTLRAVSLTPGGRAAAPTLLAGGRIDWPRRADFQRYAIALQRDWLRFLTETERRYWADMRTFLVKDLGVRAPIIGSQLGAYSTSPMQADMDVIDLHSYWSHPEFNSKLRDWSDVTVKNTSMVGAVDGGYAALPSLYRVQGKPYVITEYNHCSPNSYSAEGFPIIAAYAAMQDWDGVFVYSYSHRNLPFDSGRMPGIFDIDQHPVKMATLPIAAALFRRGDVSVAPTETVVTLSNEKALDVMRKAGTRVTADRFGAARQDALRHRISARLSDDAKDPVPAPASNYEGPIASEHGQLMWDPSEGTAVFTVNTAKTKAVIGFGKERSHRLGSLRIKPGETVQNWSMLALSQMTGGELGGPGRALLVACGYIQNTDMTWRDAEKHIPADWGRAPTLVEGVSAEFALKTDRVVEVWALDERGQRHTQVPAKRDGDAIRWSIGPAYKTLSYEVIAQ